MLSLYFAHVSLKCEHGEWLLVSSMGSIPQTFNSNKALQKGHLKRICFFFFFWPVSLVAERLGSVWQRSAAGWDARSLGKVTTVIGNCMWAGIAVLSDESPAGLVCQMFIPDAFDEFMVCVGEDAAVAICLQLWCFSCCLGWLNIKYFRTTQRSRLAFVTSHY